MKKYFAMRYYIDFARRKILLSIRRLFLIGSDVILSGSVDISPFAIISAGSGKIRMGRHCLIERGSVIRAYGGIIEIGDNCTIGPYSMIYGGGFVKIGNGTRIGPLCAIIAANHVFEDREKFIYQQGMTTKGVTISDDVWIGTGAKILDGVLIGRGAVIAAGAVVTSDVSDLHVVGGVPARVLAVRGEK